MTRKEKISFITVTVILAIYCVLVLSGTAFRWINILFMISPFLIVWLVYTFLRYGEYKGPELREDEEWGYGDRIKK